MFYIRCCRKVKVFTREEENVCPFSLKVMGEVRDLNYWVPGDAKYVEKIRYGKYLVRKSN